MTLQIPLSPETEARLRERAAAAGKDPATFVLQIVEEELAMENAMEKSSPKSQRLAELRVWAFSHPPLPYEADDSRESIYESGGE